MRDEGSRGGAAHRRQGWGPSPKAVDLGAWDAKVKKNVQEESASPPPSSPPHRLLAAGSSGGVAGERRRGPGRRRLGLLPEGGGAGERESRNLVKNFFLITESDYTTSI
jgi:hypothetical protein